MRSRTGDRKYRFGFALTTAAGNRIRYANLRKYAERDAEVECTWAPISHFLDPDPFKHWPGALRTRRIVLRQAAPVLREIGRLDAVMFHAFEPYALTILRGGLASGPQIIWSQDNPPRRHAGSIPFYGGAHARAEWRSRLRFWFDVWCLRRTDLIVPFSRWAADRLVADCLLPSERIYPIHVGLDLESWPYHECVAREGRLPRILFVGGEFLRKGGDLLLEVYRRRLAERAELHIVTGAIPADLTRDLPGGVHVHTGLAPGDPRLQALYADCDLFALPTRADMSPWAVLEAMATGRPVVATDVGGISEFVRNGETGFLLRGDDSLAARLEALVADPDLRFRMGAEGRRIVERDFSAAKCVPRILERMKQAVQAS